MTELALVVDTYKTTCANLLRDPDSAEDLSNQLTLLTAKGQRSASHLALAKRAAAIAPDNFIAMFNLASIMMRACQPSREMFLRALELAETKEQQATTQHHLGLAMHEEGQFQAALNWYSLAGDCADQSAAITRMQSGDLSALHDYEVRLHKPSGKPLSKSGITRWTGQPLKGKTLIVGHEQGFGDTLQFIRFLPEIRKLEPAKIIFSGPPVLNCLIAEQFDFDEVIGEEGPFKADYVTAPLPMAAIIKTAYRDISGEPYMSAEPMALPSRGKLKIGLSWRGNGDHKRDCDRSLSLSKLCPLFDIPGTAFYSLQVRPGAEEINKLGLGGFIADIGSLIKDWRDTAAAIAAMDVIVSVDTANAHLAGALGKPTLLLLDHGNDWRWMNNRKDTPWYKSHKLFRQPKPFEWPIEAVRAELAGML